MQASKILVQLTPFAKGPDPAIQMAVSLAKRWGAALTLFDIETDLPWPLQYLVGGIEEALESVTGTKHHLMQQRCEEVRQEGIAVEHRLTKGRQAVELIREVIKEGHDLVVKVADDSGPNRSGFLGSTDYRLLRKCPCTLLILRHDEQPGFQHVAAALDVLDDHPLQAELDQRVAEAAHSICDGTLELIYAMPSVRDAIEVNQIDRDLITPEQMEKWDADLHRQALDKLQERVRELGVVATARVLAGEPEEAIRCFVEEQQIDLLAMGTLARSGLDGMLIGNTAERILKHVTCSLLALKPADFVSPVEVEIPSAESEE